MIEQIRAWMNSLAPMWVTVGDVQMFCFENEVHSGKEVEKALFSLANDGFLQYSLDKVKNPLSDSNLTAFRRIQ
jgi:hypothetical protein